MLGSRRALWAAFVLAAGLAIVWSVGLVSAGTAGHPINSSLIHGVQWANVTDTGFTVAWITDAAIPGSGSVIFGLSPSSAFTSIAELPPPADSRGDVHVVQLTNLTASTNYFVAVSAGGTQDNNGGQYYEIKTGPALTPLANPVTVSGSITLADGQSPASGVLVSLRVLDNNNFNGSSSTTSATLAAVTSSAGTWSLVLNPRTSDNNSDFNYPRNGTNDFVQYTVEAGALGVGGTQTVSLLNTSGHLTVPTIAVSVPAATDTPSVTPTSTITPSSTVTSTVTRTPTPTLTATSASAVDNLGGVGPPTDRPPPRAPPPVPTPTPVPQPVFEPGPPLVDQQPLPAQLVLPTPVPRTVSFTPTPPANVGLRPGTSSPPPTPPIDAAPATALAAPRFPFGGTPIALGSGASQTTPGAFDTPIGSPPVRITPLANDRPAASARSVAASDGLPPVAALLLAAGLAAIGLGIAVVTIEVSRSLRNG